MTQNDEKVEVLKQQATAAAREKGPKARRLLNELLDELAYRLNNHLPKGNLMLQHRGEVIENLWFEPEKVHATTEEDLPF